MYEFKTALNTNTFVSLKILEALMQKDLTDEDKARIIAEGFAELEHRYPDLKHIATKQDLSETELKLTKEIEDVRREIKELDVRLSKEIGDVRREIKELDVKLSKEIKELDTKLSREIKELDVRLSKEIGDVRREIKELDVKIGESKLSIIKWVGGMMIGQIFIIGGLFLTAFKLFLH